MKLGEKIKELRKDRGMSAKELADKIGVTPAYISQLENGKKANPTYDILQGLQKALHDKLEDVYEIKKESVEESDDVHLITKKYITNNAIEKFGVYETDILSTKELDAFCEELLNFIKILGYKYNKGE